MSLYRERFGYREGEFPVCEDVAARSLALPFFPEMTRRPGRARGRGAARESSGAPRLARHVALRRAPGSATSRRINRSLDVDRRLWPLRRRAVARPRADARRAGDHRRRRPRRAARRARRASRPSCAAATFPFREDDEDIHMAVERRLTEIAGPVGGKLHTARSRNDQVATDVALFVREARRARRSSASTDLHGARCSTPPRRHLDWPLPGLHAPAARPAGLPRPSPARLRLDARSATASRFRFAATQVADLPLGAGALAGRQLRHRPRAWSPPSSASTGVAPNSLDAVSNRDFVLDYLGAAATCATHLSRLGAELVLWSSEEFGFVRARRTRGRAAARSCRRRRTPTPPSCCARRRRGSSATCRRCTASCTRCR